MDPHAPVATEAPSTTANSSVWTVGDPQTEATNIHSYIPPSSTNANQAVINPSPSANTNEVVISIPPSNHTGPVKTPAPPAYTAKGVSNHPPAAAHVNQGMHYSPHAAPTSQVVTIQPPGNMALRREPYVDVPDYCALAVCSILCCLCLGVYSTVKASHARVYKSQEKYVTAHHAAMTAKNFAIAAIAIGTLLTGLSTTLRILGITSSGY